MKKYFTATTLLLLFAIGGLAISESPAFRSYILSDLLSEYEQRVMLIKKQFATYKKQIDPKKLSTMEVKMKLGGFENNRNSLRQVKLRDLRKSGAPMSQTDQGDLDKRFDMLTTEFEELKKATE